MPIVALQLTRTILRTAVPHRTAVPPACTPPQVNYRTPLAVGFLIGSSFMMVNLMLITAVVSGSSANVSGVKAVTAFASLLLIFVVSVGREEPSPAE